MIYKNESGNYLFAQCEKYYYYTGNEFFLIENRSCIQSLANGDLVADGDLYKIVDFQNVCNIKALYIMLTNKCNFYCPHCIVDANITKDEELDSSLLLTFISQLKKIGLESISLSGGEPALYKDIIFVLNNILDNELEVQITTNGSTPWVWEKVGDIKLGKISFRVSMYGNNTEYREINNFDRDIVIKTILFLKKKAKDLVVLLPQEDFFSNDENIKFCNENKIRYQLGNVFSLGRYADCPPKDSSKLIVPNGNISPGPYPCMLQKLTILATGEVVFCPAIDNSFGVFGNYEDQAIDVVESTARRNFIHSINVDNKAICAKCELKYLCRGGCLATFLENGVSLHDVHPYCPFQKKGGEFDEVEKD